jgi:hypothetical protein
MILEALLLLDMPDQVAPLVKSVSDSLVRADVALDAGDRVRAVGAGARRGDPRTTRRRRSPIAWNGAAPVSVTRRARSCSSR